MRGAVSVRGAGAASSASRGGVATTVRTEVSMAWARDGRNEGRARRERDEVTGGASGDGVTTAGGSARSRWRGREGGTTTTAKVTTTTTAGKQQVRRWSERAPGGDDNYNGGDDNYPRVMTEMGPWDARMDVAGTGRNSCR